MWSSTPSCRTPWVCRVKLDLLFKWSDEASCFLQAASVAKSLLSELKQLYYHQGECRLIMQSPLQLQSQTPLSCTSKQK